LAALVAPTVQPKRRNQAMMRRTHELVKLPMK
jgi:hypothetical protein